MVGPTTPPHLAELRTLQEEKLSQSEVVEVEPHGDCQGCLVEAYSSDYRSGAHAPLSAEYILSDSPTPPIFCSQADVIYLTRYAQLDNDVSFGVIRHSTRGRMLCSGRCKVSSIRISFLTLPIQIDHEHPPKGNSSLPEILVRNLLSYRLADKHDVFGDISIDIRGTSVREPIFNMSDTEVEDDFVLPGNIAYMLYTSGTHFFLRYC